MTRSRLMLAALVVSLAGVSRADVAGDIALLRGVSGVEAASPAAQAAWSRLASGEGDVLPALLGGMQDANPIALNWLRACFDTVAERQLAAGELSLDDLMRALASELPPRARRTAFEWIVRADPAAEAKLLTAMLDDPSLELRYDAVAQYLEQAEAAADDDVKQAMYRTALNSARDLKQLETIAAALNEFGEEIDLPSVMGFLSEWRVIGPFDNAKMEHFDTAYPPERELNFTATYEGVEGEVAWQEVTAGGEGGELDLLESFGKKPEALAYAYTVFTAPAGPAEVRYQTKNATKVWLNGKLIASNEVYHSGGAIDQYRSPVELQAGENTLLVKVCQNEQKMPWETDWNFRLRVVDRVSTPVGRQEAATVSLAR